jgi:hypothetical protein
MPGVYISLCRIVVLYVPLALIGMRVFGIVSGIGAYVWARRFVRVLCAN